MFIFQDPVKQEACRLVKAEHATGSRLRRWKSKLQIQPNDTEAIVAALTKQSAKGSIFLIDALLGLLKSSSEDDSGVTRQLDSLLPVFISNKSINLFEGSCAHFSVSALTSALSVAVQSEEVFTVEILLRLGADLSALTAEELAKVILCDVPTVRHTRLEHHLRRTTFAAICDIALNGDNHPLLRRMLRDVTKAEDVVVESSKGMFNVVDRNSLLLRAIRLHKYSMLQLIIDAMPSWSLEESDVLLSTIHAIANTSEEVQEFVMMRLLDMVLDPTKMDDQENLKKAFSYCLVHQKHTILLAMLQRNLRLPAEALKLVCSSTSSTMLDKILMHKVQVSEDIWEHIALLPVIAAAGTRDKLLRHMVSSHITVPCVPMLVRQLIEANQADLMSLLICEGIHSPATDTESLALAISCRSVHIVKVLLTNNISDTSLENGMLATESLTTGNRSLYTRLLLKVISTRPRTQFLEYVLLRLLCALGVKYDQDTAKILLDAVHRDMSVINDPRMALLQPSNLNALVSCKEGLQAQFDKTERRSDSGGSEPFDLMYRDLSPQERTLSLLRRHVTECSQSFASGTPWPRAIVNFLLAWLNTKSVSSSIMTECMVVSIEYAQPEIFECFLSHSQLSLTDISTLPLPEIVAHPTYIDSIVRYFDHSGLPGHERVQLLEQYYIHACTEFNLRSATHIVSLCPRQLQANCALQCLKYAFNNAHNLELIGTLLDSTIVRQEDLENLWDYITMSRSALLEQQIPVLLKLGYRGNRIANTLLREALTYANISLIQIILDNWQMNEPTPQRSYFDYENNVPVLFRDQPEEEVLYFSILAGILHSAIQTQNLELCELALLYGAPLVDGEHSLLLEAVRYSSNVSLVEDKVLNLLWDKELGSTNAQALCDRVLLQAVISLRDILVQDMLRLKASPQAYGHQTWKSALLLSREPIFQALLSTESSYKAFQTDFCEIIESLLRQPENVDQVCISLPCLVSVGFHQSECFDHVFSLLCTSRQLSPARLSRLQHCGVRIRRDNSVYLKFAMMYPDFQVFEVMLSMCADKSALTACFASATDIIVNGQTVEYPSSFGALNYLVTLDMPQYAIDSIFQQLMTVHSIPARLRPVLIQLLRKKAFIGNDGKSFARCYLMDDDDLVTAMLASRPPIQVCENALQWLLTGEDWRHLKSLTKRRNEKCRIGVPHSTIRNLIGFVLSTPDAIPHGVVRTLFKIIEVDSTLQPCGTNCSQELEGLLLSVISNLEQEPLFMPSRLANLSTIIQHLKEVGPHWGCGGIGGVGETCSLDNDATTSLLLLACEKGFVELVVDLLALDVDPNSADAAGQTALCIAAKNGHDTVIELLVEKGAHPDDGSLHIAVCSSHRTTISLLLNFGHSPLYESALFGGVTVLKAFMESEHEDITNRCLGSTLMELLLWMYQALDFDTIARELVSVWKTALQSRRADDLMNELSDVLGTFDEPLELLQNAEFEVGNLRYSALSLINHWNEAKLTQEQRMNLSQIFELHGFKPVIYAEEGDQPENAINIPVQYHQRHAFRTKECAVCGDKAKSENDIFAGLVDACVLLHGWDDDVICSECLAEYLQTKMFPHEDEVLKFNFPSAAVPCWAPQCQKTMLTHDDLRRLVDRNLFFDYDEALCQQMINAEKSFVKCATLQCPGGIWCDEDTNKEENKHFFCELCGDDTCIECNALFSTHNGEPCPVSAEANKGERIKEEERLSEAALKLEKRCPKCQAPYQKISGMY